MSKSNGISILLCSLLASALTNMHNNHNEMKNIYKDIEKKHSNDTENEKYKILMKNKYQYYRTNLLMSAATGIFMIPLNGTKKLIKFCLFISDTVINTLKPIEDSLTLKNKLKDEQNKLNKSLYIPDN